MLCVKLRLLFNDILIQIYMICTCDILIEEKHSKNTNYNLETTYLHHTVWRQMRTTLRGEVKSCQHYVTNGLNLYAPFVDRTCLFVQLWTYNGMNLVYHFFVSTA